MNKKTKDIIEVVVAIIITLGMIFSPKGMETIEKVIGPFTDNETEVSTPKENKHTVKLTSSENIITSDEVPNFDGKTYIFEINGNQPTIELSEFDLNKENYFTNIQPLDDLGRAQASTSLVSQNTRQYEKRAGSPETPLGYEHITFDKNGKQSRVYDRCHLVAYSLSLHPKVNDVENVVTGTREFNYSSRGMNIYEDMVRNAVDTDRDYADTQINNNVQRGDLDTKVEVLYQVAPIYKGNDVVPLGVQMQAKTIKGDVNVNYNVFVYNIKDEGTIDYATGEFTLDK